MAAAVACMQQSSHGSCGSTRAAAEQGVPHTASSSSSSSSIAQSDKKKIKEQLLISLCAAAAAAGGLELTATNNYLVSAISYLLHGTPFDCDFMHSAYCIVSDTIINSETCG